MVQLAQEYIVAELPEGEDFTPIPDGEYCALIVASEMKATKSGTGAYLELEIDITDGDYKGRKLYERLNLENLNAQTVERAYQTLGDICRALSVEKINNSDQLHNTPFNIKIDIVPGKPYTKDGVEKQGNPQNRIKKYMPFAQLPISAGDGSSVKPPHTEHQQQSQPAKPSAPWATK